MLIFIQKHASQLHGQTLSVPSLLHDGLGNDLMSHGSYEKASSVHVYAYRVADECICSFVGALLTRFFLGFVEAAFFPGALFLLSKWYKREELGVRTAVLSCGSLISNAFGSLMASGILDGMQGKLGHSAWRCARSFRTRLPD